ncbi:unnamed protein product, partial [Prorocentrum cordatum]
EATPEAGGRRRACRRHLGAGCAGQSSPSGGGSLRGGGARGAPDGQLPAGRLAEPEPCQDGCPVRLRGAAPGGPSCRLGRGARRRPGGGRQAREVPGLQGVRLPRGHGLRGSQVAVQLLLPRAGAARAGGAGRGQQQRGVRVARRGSPGRQRRAGGLAAEEGLAFRLAAGVLPGDAVAAGARGARASAGTCRGRPRRGGAAAALPAGRVAARSGPDSGLLHAAAAGIREALCSGAVPQGGPRRAACVLAHDEGRLSFFCAGGRGEPRVLVVSDLQDPFLPLPAESLVDYSDGSDGVVAILDALPQLVAGAAPPPGARAPGGLHLALGAALLALRGRGGKLVAFTAEGAGAARGLQEGAASPYTALASDMVKAKVSAEVFVATPARDGAGIADLACLTDCGGELWHFPEFDCRRDGRRLGAAVGTALGRHRGWEAQLRVRVPRGWKAERMQGHCARKNREGKPGLAVLPNCHAEQTFAVEVRKASDELGGAGPGSGTPPLISSAC